MGGLLSQFPSLNPKLHMFAPSVPLRTPIQHTHCLWEGVLSSQLLVFSMLAPTSRPVFPKTVIQQDKVGFPGGNHGAMVRRTQEGAQGKAVGGACGHQSLPYFLRPQLTSNLIFLHLF